MTEPRCCLRLSGATEDGRLVVIAYVENESGCWNASLPVVPDGRDIYVYIGLDYYAVFEAVQNGSPARHRPDRYVLLSNPNDLQTDAKTYFAEPPLGLS